MTDDDDPRRRGRPEEADVTTYFAPAERASPEVVESAIQALTAAGVLHEVLRAVNVLAAILNHQRQIVFASDDFAAASLPALVRLEGLRPGEALGCVNAAVGPGGCGTSPACASCGAAISLVESQRTGQPVELECVIGVAAGRGIDYHEYRVRSVPLLIAGQPFTLFTLRDISAEKRRQVLEHVFFHDVLNTVTAIHGYVGLLELPGFADTSAVLGHLSCAVQRLERELSDQRALVEAEAGTLWLAPRSVTVDAVLDIVEPLYSGVAALEQSLEVVRGPGADAALVTDVDVLVRVLSNMIKNALEATPRGATGLVRVWAESDAASCTFAVWNPGAIPPGVSSLIFKRSFSTKATHGRGLGTYSMKLFGERYLGGEVRFTTGEGAGTTFSIRLPRGGPPRLVTR